MAHLTIKQVHFSSQLKGSKNFGFCHGVTTTQVCFQLACYETVSDDGDLVLSQDLVM